MSNINASAYFNNKLLREKTRENNNSRKEL